MSSNSTSHVQLAVADPTPLGLFGLAVVTMVASAQKMGIVSDVSWVLPWALFCGSFAQLLAGVLDYCHRNIFGGTIFCAFGFFWSKLVPSVLVWLKASTRKLSASHSLLTSCLQLLVPLLLLPLTCSSSPTWC